MDDIRKNLENYRKSHEGKEFKTDVSTKTIEDICQLLQCQPEEIIECKVELNPELSFENVKGKSEIKLERMGFDEENNRIGSKCELYKTW